MDNISNQIKLSERENLVPRIFRYFSLLGFEGFIWTTALIYLAFFINPFETHFTICPLANAGFEHCPGCGLGNSISLLFHGYIVESFDNHILGIPALLIIFHRIYSIIKFNLNKQKTII